MEQKIYDTLIIGGGPAGYTAALYCARANLSTLLLEKLSPGGQMGTTAQVDNYPGFGQGINGMELALRMQEGAEGFGAITQLAEALEVRLNDQPKLVISSSGDFLAHSLILAGGASPRELGLKGERELRGRGVSYCATCDGMFYRNKEVAVVGGGDTAVADALFLAPICAKVHLIHRRDSLRAGAAQVRQLEQLDNVEIHWQSQVQELIYDKKLQGLILRHNLREESTQLNCQGLFVAVGFQPNTQLFAGQLPLDQGGYIPADETTRTTVEGVFAVGDLRAKPLRQIVTAVADGAVAAKYAAEYVRQTLSRGEA